MEEDHDGAVECVMKSGAVEAGRICAYEGRDFGESSTAGCGENEMVGAGDDMLLGWIRKFLADDSAVPRVGGLLILFGAPQLDWNGDVLQAAGAE